MFSVESRFIEDKAVAPPRLRFLQQASGAATLLIATVFIASTAFAVVNGHSNEDSGPLKNPPTAPEAVEASQVFAFIGSPQSEYHSASGEGQFTPNGQLVGGR